MPVARGVAALVLSVVLAACVGSTPSPTVPAASTPEPTAGPTLPTSSDPAATPAPTVPPVTPDPTTAPTDAPQPSAGPVGDATWAANPPTPILIASIVRVTAAELTLREEPFQASAETGTVAAGTILYVEEAPPVESDGSIWYRGSVVSADGTVPPLPASIPVVDGDGPFGWFEASTGADRFVSRVAARCPDVVNLKRVAAMTAYERLACFGGDWIEVEGTFRCYTTCLGDALGDFEPAWLAYPANLDFVFAGPTDEFGLHLSFPPTVARPERGTKVRIRGHLRDAASDTCTISSPYWWPPDPDTNHPYADAVAQLLCRQAFVVERVEVIEAG